MTTAHDHMSMAPTTPARKAHRKSGWYNETLRNASLMLTFYRRGIGDVGRRLRVPAGGQPGLALSTAENARRHFYSFKVGRRC